MTPELSAGPVTRQNRILSWSGGRMSVVFTGMGVVGFLLLRLPVSDLQAADARAAADAHGVGVTYWFGWFGGTVPGRYSVLSPWLSDAVGVRLAAGLAILGTVASARRAIGRASFAAGGVWLVVAMSLCNLWSGRVAFCLGAFPAVLAVTLLIRGRGWAAGVVNLLAALFSPLAAAFAVLAVCGWLFLPTDRRAPTWRFASITGAGILGLSVTFGSAGPTPFDRPTLLKVMAVMLLPQVLRLTRPGRIGLGLSALACVVCYLVPMGVGGNIVRYALFIAPVVVWFCSDSPRGLVLAALVPASVYGIGLTAVDLVAADQASAVPGYYAGVAEAITRQPDLTDHRVEALDPPTHTSSYQLAQHAWLARGWDLQTDAAENPLFYGRARLDAASYRQWLSSLAVGWVAVPDRINSHDRAEAALIAGGLPYLREVWSDQHWTLYSVVRPTPLVEQPASIIRATDGELVVSMPRAGSALLRIRDSVYLTANAVAGSSSARLQNHGPLQVQLTVSAPGRYRITGAATAANWWAAVTGGRR